jgi:membrane-bound lytic murein transglycosylase A
MEDGLRRGTGLNGPATASIRRFFESRFQPWLLTNPDATTSGLITGYYEPLLHGARTRAKPFLQPVLGVPPDSADHRPRRGPAGSEEHAPARPPARQQGGSLFFACGNHRREKDNPDRVLLWVDDPVELFFLQVQGSGRVKLPDGQTTRLAYADQNGHPYQSIGRVLVDRGELSLEQASMAGIKQWARANPGRVNELLNANPSYVFFREQPIRAARTAL